MTTFFRFARRLAPVDAKSVRRDPLLSWVVFAPFLMALAFRALVPVLADLTARRAGFDLSPYFPLIGSFFLLVAPTIAGTVVGFLLLDERDEQITTALRVTPLPVPVYLAYRVLMPAGLGALTTLLAFPLLGFVSLPLLPLIALTLLNALTAPLTALVLGAFAENKVAGLALLKMLNAALMIPVAAYFLPGRWGLLTGVVPTYWGLQATWLAFDGGPFAVYALAGAVYGAAVVAALAARYRARL